MESKKYSNFKKRRFAFGIALLTFVAGLIFAGLTAESYAGCAGDCMSCHEKLKGDKNHTSLTTCVACHDPAKPKTKMSLNLSQGSDGCGDRCFTCHSQWPKDSYHASLETCLNCHNK